MREVNRETLIDAIEYIEQKKAIFGELAMSTEFSLTAYKMLLTTMEVEPVTWTSEEAIAEVYCDKTAMMGPKHMVGDVALYRRTILDQK